MLLVHNGKTNPGIKVERFFDAQLPDVFLDRNAFEQVLWNVLINAIQAMPEGGAITLKTLPSVRTPGGRPHQEVTVIITDTGAGMPQETLSRAFHPFFSTKARGTGLGLSIVQRIVHSHGGRITLSSTAGKGTQVRITLPVSSCEVQAKKGGEDGVHIDSR